MELVNCEHCRVLIRVKYATVIDIICQKMTDIHGTDESFIVCGPCADKLVGRLRVMIRGRQREVAT